MGDCGCTDTVRCAYCLACDRIKGLEAQIGLLIDENARLRGIDRARIKVLEAALLAEATAWHTVGDHYGFHGRAGHAARSYERAARCAALAGKEDE